MLVQRMHPADNAIVALRNLPEGATVCEGQETWIVPEAIPAKHKFAAERLAAGDRVLMYGVTVGIVRREVGRGAWLRPDDVAHATDPVTIRPGANAWEAPDVSRWQHVTFDGFRRSDGSCGTANYWIVAPLVFCENRNIEVMREALTKGLGYDITSPYTDFVREMVRLHREGGDLSGLSMNAARNAAVRVFPNVDGVKFLLHGLGCGGTREDARTLCALLAGYIDHPNVAGATILSLGCQNAQVDLLREALAGRAGASGKKVLVFEQQKSASERDLIARALRETFKAIAAANELRREPCPIAAITLGLKCGGSDGFSGLSANPVLGHTSDLLVTLGGASVLCEFPELCGAEQHLCDRCVTPELAGRFLELMRNYDAWARAIGSGFHANPSPGNIRDGLITDAMKSVGAARKSGNAPIVDVVDYSEPVLRRGGVSLLCSPGNDVEATTALAGSGCNVIVFTTGLGTPTGNPVCPTIKMSTNSELSVRMADLIDFDAGPVIDGTATIAERGEALLDYVIEVASGRVIPAAVRLGQDDFIPWKRGVSL